MDNPLQDLQIQIEAHIDACDSKLTPRLCDFRSTEGGRDKLRKYITEKVLRLGLTIGQAMQEIEREFNHNLID